MRVRSQRTLGSVVTVLLLSGLAACGVRGQHDATKVDAEDVPFDLLEPGTTTIPEPPRLPAPDEVVEICFLDPQGQLVPLLVAAPSDRSLGPITNLLANPPIANLFGVKLSTAVAEPEQLSVTRDRGAADVALDQGFTEMPADAQLAAIAQLVCTLTAQPGVGEIGFSLDGVPVEVPRADGSLTRDPVVRSDYDRLLGN